MGSIVAIKPLMSSIRIDERLFKGKNNIIDGDNFENLIASVSPLKQVKKPGTNVTLGQATGIQAPIPPSYSPGISIPSPVVGNPINNGGGGNNIPTLPPPADPNTGVTIPGGEGTWGESGGFGEGGWGTGGGMGGGGYFGGDDGMGGGEGEGEAVALGTDELGCPIYGYNEAGQALYGIDQFGNVITDPTVLPCAMKAKENGKTPGAKKDNTWLYVLLGVGAVALYAAVKK
jgi:hypothetical protein